MFRIATIDIRPGSDWWAVRLPSSAHAWVSTAGFCFKAPIDMYADLAAAATKIGIPATDDAVAWFAMPLPKGYEPPLAATKASPQDLDLILRLGTLEHAKKKYLEMD